MATTTTEINSVEIADQFGDQLWRLHNLYWIINKEGKRVRFKPNWAQERLLREMRQNHLILKVRQLGASTLLMLLGLDSAIFTPNFVGVTISHDRESMRKMFRRNVRTPFLSLPEQLRKHMEAHNESAHELVLANGSSYSVALSVRSDTVHYLHVSEFAKICAKYPLKAVEIVTGSFEAVPEATGIKVIESTAEGQYGYFYDYCQDALKAQQEGRPLAAGDWSISFLPWWLHPEYVASPRHVVITAPLLKYFHEIEGKIGRSLGPARRAWYCGKWKRLGDRMKQEYPSTPEEAFEATIEGAYYAEQMADVRRSGRICDLPHDPSYRTETWWDLGVDDATAVWFVQRAGGWLHVIDYREWTGEGLQTLARHVADIRQERGMMFSRHVGPHDLKVREWGNDAERRVDVAARLGLDFEVCPEHAIADRIEAVRNILPRCRFDAERCEEGIKALDSYQKEWDEVRATYRTKPLHNWASHGADAFGVGVMAGNISGGVRKIAPTGKRPRIAV
ncbi:terminase [bacterium]|nr:terminase [bacterium]